MSQFVEVIEFLDNSGNEIVHRIPEEGSGEIKLGAQLIVRESQVAIFFRDGKALDTFGPGSYMLSTQNIPILTKILALPYGFESPFKAEVYFIGKKVFTNLGWGTKEPILLHDRELKMVRLRAFGIFSIRIAEPQLFLNKLVGTQGIYKSDAAQDFLRGIIGGRFADLLGGNLKTVFDLPAYYDELAALLKGRVKEDFEKYGLDLVDLIINSISLPEDVQKMVDERAGLEAVGGLDKYLQFKAAKALEEAAKNPGGGAASAGVGLGAGAGLGISMVGMIQQAAQSTPAQGIKTCGSCSMKIPATAKFCSECGAKQT